MPGQAHRHPGAARIRDRGLGTTAKCLGGPHQMDVHNRESPHGAVEEVARLVARIRARWPRTRILLRADSGFAREDLMAWCEANGVDFLFGLAQNERLIAEIKTELDLV